MASVQISELPVASTPLAGTELIPIVQSGITDQVTVANLTAGRAISASSVTVSGLDVNAPVFINGSNTLATNTAFSFNGTNLTLNTGGKLLVGAATSAAAAGIQNFGPGSSANVGIRRYSNDATGPTLALQKSRDATAAGFTTLQTNDQVGSVAFLGTQGSGFAAVAVIDSYIDPTGTVSATSLPGMITMATVPDGALGVGTERLRITCAGNIGVNSTSPTARMYVNGSFALKAPSSVNAATYTVGADDYSLRFTTTNCTVTLPSAVASTGRILVLNTITANSVASASSNVIPLGSNVAGTAILSASAGKFAMLQSDGSNWITLLAN